MAAKNPRLTRALRAALLPLAGVLAAGTIACMAAGRLSRGAVDIVPRPSAAPASTEAAMSALPAITGEPDDIGEDYDEPPAAEATDAPIYEQIPIEEDIVNILVLGTDLRPRQSGRGRSDTMMLLSYDRKLRKATLISIMRDCWVHIEGCGWNRVNAAYSFGGIGLAVNTVNDLLHTDIQEYIVVDFGAMTALVDEIGGVDVSLTAEEARYYNRQYGWDAEAGSYHMDGEKALLHARNRKSGGGDFERVRRQQDILLAIYQRYSDENDPQALAGLLEYALTRVQTNIAPQRLFTLGMELLSRDPPDIRRGRIPADGSWSYANMDGRSVLSIDVEKNRAYVMKLCYGEDE